MVQCLAARFRRAEGNSQLVFGLFLADELPQPFRSQLQFKRFIIFSAVGGNQPLRFTSTGGHWHQISSKGPFLFRLPFRLRSMELAVRSASNREVIRILGRIIIYAFSK